MYTPSEQKGPFLPKRLVFEECELDLGRYELRRAGRAVKLEKQPLEILIFMLERPGELITRDEIKSRLWAEDVFLDAEQGINNGIRKIRVALGDDSETPRYIETVVGRGYRFKAQIRDVAKPFTSTDENRIGNPVENVGATTSPAAQNSSGPTQLFRLTIRYWIALGAVLVTGLSLGLMPNNARERLFGFKPARPSIRSLAVLPLENMSGDPKQDYFADGMTEELTTDLAKIDSLKVISRSSAMSYKGSPKSAQQIGRELNVQALIEGSVTRSAGRVRVTAQLIDASTDRHLWAESYERDAGDVLELQRDVAWDISNQVQFKVGSNRTRDVTSAQHIQPAAYDLYLQGKGELEKRNPEALNNAIRLFQQSIAKDPSARAYAALADCYNLLLGERLLPTGEARFKAQEAAHRALQMDDTISEVQASAAFSLWANHGDRREVEKGLQRALQLDASNATAHLWYSNLLDEMGRTGEGLVEAEKARDLDPLSAIATVNLSAHYYRARRYDDAVRQAENALQVNPEFVKAYGCLIVAYVEKRMFLEAARALVKLNQYGKQSNQPFLYENSLVEAASGQRRKALETVSTMQARWREHLEVDAVDIAAILSELGQKDEALQWLEKDTKDGVDDLLTPPFDNVRTEPRFQRVFNRRLALIRDGATKPSASFWRYGNS